MLTCDDLMLSSLILLSACTVLLVVVFWQHLRNETQQRQLENLVNENSNLQSIRRDIENERMYSDALNRIIQKIIQKGEENGG